MRDNNHTGMTSILKGTIETMEKQRQEQFKKEQIRLYAGQRTKIKKGIQCL